MRARYALAVSLTAWVCGCETRPAAQSGETAADWSAAQSAATNITAEDILTHTRTLSSDEFEGRAPGTHGEELTVAYITDQFKKLGLTPGNPDGSYVQNVPLIGYTNVPSATLNAGGKNIALAFQKDYIAASRHFRPQVDVDNSDLVFVGYGVVAPEFGWDDYKGADVRGKTIVMLVNDPPVRDAADTSKLDANTFKGKAMTYYGRWTYKYSSASEHGAAAAIIIHETGPAGYPFEVLSGSAASERFDIKSPTPDTTRVKVEAWITEPKARELLKAAGQDFDALKRAAVSKDFKPVPLNAKVSFHLKNTIREIESKNVIGKLEGGSKKDEYIVYTAHWDHLGRDSTLQGDQIFNGAVDNATGTAAIIEIADAFNKLPQKPNRSILFLAVTAEEKGLLGAKYYAENPLYPLNKTLANINIDAMGTWGRTRDIDVVGYGNSNLEDVLAEAAKRQNRTIAPDAEPEKGFFYRSDQFEFAKQGVPALYSHRSANTVDRPPSYGLQKREEYTANDYHKPSDEIKPDWDLRGAVEDTQLMFLVGYAVAQREAWPEWKEGNEFKAKREEMLGKQ